MAKPFTVVAPIPVLIGPPKILPRSRERHPYTQINPSDIATPDGKVDPDKFAKLMKQMQDSVDSATTPYRTNPLLLGEVHRQVSTTSGHNLVIKHSLGEPFGSWKSVRAYAGSSVFSAVEAKNNGGMSPSDYLVLAMSSTGTYDIEINPS
jgi:hypothetical protein